MTPKVSNRESIGLALGIALAVILSTVLVFLLR